MTIRRLNHAVLYVRDAARAATFYVDVLRFEIATQAPHGVFLRAHASPNDHDLGLFSVGEQAAGPIRGAVGLYHLAWQVDTLDDLLDVRSRLAAAGALVGESDHHVSKSLYAKDLDGIEFEVMWAVPRSDWTDEVGTVRLDLEAARARWAGVRTAGEANIR